MVKDSHYLQASYRLSEIEHRYGKNIHILNHPFLFTTLGQLCRPECTQPLVNQLLNTLYKELVTIVLNQEFPQKKALLESRMKALHPEGVFEGPIIDPETKVACVSLARAGTVPSQICYDAFTYLLNPSGVRQDHIAINRKIDSSEKVIGTELGGIKIGGDVNDTIVVFPDPMGATGSTIKTSMQIYANRGKAKKYIAIHLIVTPEYLSMMASEFKDIIVYAIRLDRGLSSEKILSTVPGTHWKEERGLNAKQYIVPGAGGLGEVINNSYV